MGHGAIQQYIFLYSPYSTQSCTITQHSHYIYCSNTVSLITNFLSLSAEWIIAAGVCALVSVAALAAFSLFAILHVAMQLQRREICVAFSTAVFLKVLTSSVAGEREIRK